MQSLQKEAEAHIHRVQDICSLEDDDYFLLDDQSGTAADLAAAQKRKKLGNKSDKVRRQAQHSQDS